MSFSSIGASENIPLSLMQRLIEALCARFRGTTVNIVAAHLMAAGGVLGGGERSAHTIFDYAVSQGLPVVEVHLWETDDSCASYHRERGEG